MGESHQGQAEAATTARTVVKVPAIVLGAAAILPAVALVLALAAAILVRFAEPYGDWGSAFPTVLGLLAGQQVGVRAGSGFLAVDGSAALRVVPFGLVTIAAYVLLRVGFTRAWLEVRGALVLPALVGVGATFLVTLLAMVAARTVSVDAIIFEASMSVRPSLSGLLVVGAGPWLLAYLAARKTELRHLLVGTVALQILVAFGVAFAAMRSADGAGGAEFFATTTLGFLAGIAWSLNLLAAAVWLPFLGAVGIGGSVAKMFSSLGGDVPVWGFIDLATAYPLFWIAPLVSLGGIGAMVWFRPVPASLEEVRRATVWTAASVTVLFLPALWMGRMRLVGGGEVAHEALAEVAWIFDLRFDATDQLTFTLGATGMPFRFIPALAVWSLVAAGVLVLRAQLAGVPWASSSALAEQGMRSGVAMAERARALAASAQASAASATQAARDAQASSPTAPPTGQGGVAPDESAPAGVGGPAEGAPEAAGEPTASAAPPPSWLQAPPPSAGNRYEG